MKVVFDTNVLISGFLTTTGPSYYVVRLAIKNFEVLISEYILDEARSKLSKKLKVPSTSIEMLERFLRKRAFVLPVATQKDIEFSDKKDIPILSLLRVGKPHYFVTGDKRLLQLKKFDTTLILSPREAMEALHSHL